MNTVLSSAALVLCLCSVPAVAQESSNVSGWTGKATIDLGFRLGSNLPANSNPDLVEIDESEFGARIAFSRKSADGLVPLDFRFGITHAPGLLPSTDPSSSYFGRVTVGDTFLPLRDLTLASDPTASASAVTDALRPYAYYQYSSVHDGLLEDRSREDHELAAGLRYRDVVTIMADRAMNGSAVEVGAASNTPGWYWEVSGQFANIWSNDPARERFVPQARLSVYAPPMGGVRLFAKGQADFSFYRSALTPAGDHREDQRIRLTAGVDVSSLLADLGDVSFELAGQFQRQWSSDATVESSRAYFLPTASISIPF